MLLRANVQAAEVTVNLRAEAAPEALEAALRGAVGEMGGAGVSLEVKGLQAFRPGQPKPTHRIVA